jgi:hypothetical protein
MPIRRFRSVEEMTPATVGRSGGAGLRAAVAVSRTCLTLARRRPPAGVHKFRSSEHAREARLCWEREEDRATD